MQNESTPITSIQLATLANQLLLLGQTIATFSTNTQIIIVAAYIKLLAGLLFIMAAKIESNEQQIAPGVTTPLNNLKFLGASISEIGAVVLTYVLQEEARIKQLTGGQIQAPTITPFTGPAFA